MRRLYSGLIALLAPFAMGMVIWRGLRDRVYWQHLGERWGMGPARGDAPLWLHAVSLGEMSAAAPLLRATQTRYPDLPILLTTATPAGRARALALFPQLEVRYLPYDTRGSVRRFFERTRPRFAVIMETELWPNLFAQCRTLGIPVLIANARLTQKSVRAYRRFGGLLREIFAGAVQVGAQTPEDAQRFGDIGAAAIGVHVVGNIKFDVQPSAAVIAAGERLRVAAGVQRPVWIAGSTHPGEEDQILDAHYQLLQSRADALLLLAPRHSFRFDAVADLLTRRGVEFVRRSDGALGPGDRLRATTQVVLVDTLGELQALYAAADVAFVGGSLVAIGGHNLLEPAALGKPVITGPSQSNAPDIARLLLQSGAALQVGDAPQLSAVVLGLLGDAAEARRMGAAGQALVATHRGSVERLLDLIAPSLAEGRPSATR